MPDRNKSLSGILLTSVIKPLGPAHGDAESVGYELLHAQITRAQGIFSPRAVHRQFSLDYLAENIDNPATVLHYPSAKELARELKKGYGWVGISFINATYHRMTETVKIIRKFSPGTKIILGGYGTSLPDYALSPWCDYVSKGEGVARLREILGNPPAKKPYKHPVIGSELSVFSKKISYTGMIFAGLGCPNGCDFCSTSHYFRRKHVKLLETGREIYDVVKKHLAINPGAKFTVIDEDFLLDKKRAIEFKGCVQHGGISLSIFVFASAKALSMYETKDLLAMGIDGVWIGYEGERAAYGKKDGVSMEKIFTELHSNGILILSSMIIGFDYQSEAIINDEFDRLMSLKPDLAQFLICNPIAGTPLYENALKNSSLRPEYTGNEAFRWKMSTGFKSVIRHPTMSASDLERIQEECFKKDYFLQGPSIYRILETMFNGWLKHRNSPIPALASKARLFAREIRKAYPVMLASRFLVPDSPGGKKTGFLKKRIYAQLGKPTAAEYLLSGAVLVLAAWTALKLKFGWFQHPCLVRKTWRTAPPRFALFKRLRFSGEGGFFVGAYENRRKREVLLRGEGFLNWSQAENFVRGVADFVMESSEKIRVDLSGMKIEKSCVKFVRDSLKNFKPVAAVYLPGRARVLFGLLFLFKRF